MAAAKLWKSNGKTGTYKFDAAAWV